MRFGLPWSIYFIQIENHANFYQIPFKKIEKYFDIFVYNPFTIDFVHWGYVGPNLTKMRGGLKKYFCNAILIHFLILEDDSKAV